MRKKLIKVPYKRTIIYCIKSNNQYNINNMVRLLKLVKRTTHANDIYIRNYNFSGIETISGITGLDYLHLANCVTLTNTPYYDPDLLKCLNIDELINLFIAYRKRYGNVIVLISEGVYGACGFSEITLTKDNTLNILHLEV